MPEKEYLTFPGGWIAKHLFEEARYCFVYAQFLASISLGMAYIEHTLAALLFGTGRSHLERANISELLSEAVSLNWPKVSEFTAAFSSIIKLQVGQDNPHGQKEAVGR